MVLNEHVPSTLASQRMSQQESPQASPAQPLTKPPAQLLAKPEAPHLQLNPQARVRFFHIGKSRTPLLVIDDAISDIDAWCAHAANQSFSRADAWYPGIRAALPASYYQPLLQALVPLVSQLVFALAQVGSGAGSAGNVPAIQAPTPLRLELEQAVYSLITEDPTALDVLQRLPHVDSVSVHKLALVHYLAPGEHGGTAFYQHLSTGLELLSDNTEPRYLAACQDFLNRHGVPHGYPSASMQLGPGAQYQVLQKVQYQQNRLLVYPGALLHAAEVLAQDIQADPALGRLTANLFFEWHADSA